VLPLVAGLKCRTMGRSPCAFTRKHSKWFWQWTRCSTTRR